jgi:hypothetical protein
MNDYVRVNLQYDYGRNTRTHPRASRFLLKISQVSESPPEVKAAAVIAIGIKMILNARVAKTNFQGSTLEFNSSFVEKLSDILISTRREIFLLYHSKQRSLHK